MQEWCGAGRQEDDDVFAPVVHILWVSQLSVKKEEDFVGQVVFYCVADDKDCKIISNVVIEDGCCDSGILVGFPDDWQ